MASTSSLRFSWSEGHGFLVELRRFSSPPRMDRSLFRVVERAFESQKRPGATAGTRQARPITLPIPFAREFPLLCRSGGKAVEE